MEELPAIFGAAGLILALAQNISNYEPQKIEWFNPKLDTPFLSVIRWTYGDRLQPSMGCKHSLQIIRPFNTPNMGLGSNFGTKNWMVDKFILKTTSINGPQQL